MVLHELTTNAVKYGAFSVPSGRLDVTWAVNDGEWLSFVWAESGVQIDGPPDTRGFGTGMIEKSFSHSLNGESSLEFGSDGLVCRFAIPLHTKSGKAN